MRRMLVGMSQERLGEALGITFQQVQKYEKGTNRIGASRLQQISGILSVPVDFFFEGSPQANHSLVPGFREKDSQASLLEFLSTPEAIQLNRAFKAITDPIVRRKIVDLVVSLSNETGKG